MLSNKHINPNFSRCLFLIVLWENSHRDMGSKFAMGLPDHPHIALSEEMATPGLLWLIVVYWQCILAMTILIILTYFNGITMQKKHAKNHGLNRSKGINGLHPWLC